MQSGGRGRRRGQLWSPRTVMFEPKPEPRKVGLAYYLVRLGAVSLPALLVCALLFSAAALVLRPSAYKPWQGPPGHSEEGRVKGGWVVLGEPAAPTADSTRPGGRKLEPTNPGTHVRAPTLPPSHAPTGEHPTPPDDQTPSPTPPTHPSHPSHPSHPTRPTHPTHPTPPTQPTHPTHPTQPTQPNHPAHPPHP
jgi:hypothetical protein